MSVTEYVEMMYDLKNTLTFFVGLIDGLSVGESEASR